MTAQPNEPADPNAHVRDYLAYYIGFKQPPRYAVMLSGRWGAGKTHQVKKILNDLLPPASGPIKKQYVLVSLYGLKSPQEIDDAMVAALYPWTDNDGVRIATSVGKAILKHAKIELPALKSADLLNRMSADVFVFDDLERCRMPVTDAFGYINQLVERDGCKVIVLANQDEIKDQSEYRNGKEKLIGKTLEVEPDFDEAFSEFWGKIEDRESHDFITGAAETIEAVYDQSNLKNLRILQQTMWDFERLYKNISSRHKANVDAMNHLIRLFFVLCFEYKSGGIDTKDVENRTSRSMFSTSGSDSPSPLSKAGAKYAGLYLYDTILSDHVVADILVRGLVDPIAIGAALDASSWFAAANEPSWRTVWYSLERPDADVEEAAKVMMGEFDARRYTVTGAMLHLFGQMLFLADIGFSGRTRSETVQDCKNYVDDLRKRGDLEAPREAFLESVRHGSYGGLGFSQNGTEEFRELWAYVNQQRSEAEKDGYRDEASELIELMRKDCDAFVRQITYHRGGSAPFADRPVFAAISPEIFAEALIGLDPSAFREALLGLSARYDMGKLSAGRELAEERGWVEMLDRELVAQAAKFGPFKRERISKNVEWILTKVLVDLREAESEQAAV